MKKLSMILAVFLYPYGLPAQTATQNTGIPPFSSLSSSGFDSVNNQNLNAYFTIPLVSSPGRGIPLNLPLSYNTLVWQPVNSGGTTTWTSVTDLSGNPTWGWAKDITVGGLPSRNVLRPAPGRIAAEVCDRSPCRRTTGIHWLPNERVVTKRKVQRNAASRAGDQGNSEIRVQVLVVYAIEPARTERAERWNASVLGSGLSRKAIRV